MNTVHSDTGGGGKKPDTSTKNTSTTTTNTTEDEYSLTQTHSKTEGGSDTKGGSTEITRATGKVDDTTLANREKYNKDYVPSQAVTDAYNQLQEHLKNQPGAFQSKYQDQLTSLYDQIINGKEFSYNPANDSMYQMYKQQYEMAGNSAMQDTMGQMAAMTGGYMNSAAQSAGQQAYQNYVSQLSDRAFELQQNAYNRYKDAQQTLRDNYGIVKGAYDDEYGQYRDTVGDWQKDRDYLQDTYTKDRDFDYDTFRDNRDYWNDEYWNELNAEQTTDKDWWEHTDSWETTDTTSETWSKKNKSTVTTTS